MRHFAVSLVALLSFNDEQFKKMPAALVKCDKSALFAAMSDLR